MFGNKFSRFFNVRKNKDLAKNIKNVVRKLEPISYETQSYLYNFNHVNVGLEYRSKIPIKQSYFLLILIRLKNHRRPSG